jgi:hypothetical protein
MDGGAARLPEQVVECDADPAAASNSELARQARSRLGNPSSAGKAVEIGGQARHVDVAGGEEIVNRHAAQRSIKAGVGALRPFSSR